MAYIIPIWCNINIADISIMEVIYNIFNKSGHSFGFIRVTWMYNSVVLGAEMTQPLLNIAYVTPTPGLAMRKGAHTAPVQTPNFWGAGPSE
jgi:hypothetical protein